MINRGVANNNSDNRRNLTDLQETSQWLAGHAFWSNLITSLAGDSPKNLILINTSLYDGFLEEAALELGVPIFSMTDTAANFHFATALLRERLLQAVYADVCCCSR